MKAVVGITSLLALSMCFGCARFSPNYTASPKNASQFVQSGKVINIKPLEKGGTVLLVPFKAGEQVAITDRTDKVALLLIRGLLDVLENNNEGLDVIFSENFEQADFIVDGHITRIKEPTKVQRWFMGKRNVVLTVEGKVIERKTGNTLLVFNDSKKSREKFLNHQQLGQMIGQDIGKFILSALK